MSYSDLSRRDKIIITREVERAIWRRDIKLLKTLLPTIDDLLEFHSEGKTLASANHGSSVLHLVFRGQENSSSDSTKQYSSQFDFLKAVFNEYDLDNHPEEKMNLLLQRDSRGKLAADFLYLYHNNFLSQSDKINFETHHPSDREELQKSLLGKPDNRTEYEKNKERMYNFLKSEIKKFLPALGKKELRRPIVNDSFYLDENFTTYSAGIPVTPGSYSFDEDGNPIAYMVGSIEETYPEIRLRNIGTNGKEEDGRIIRNLSFEKPLLEQVINNIDFPEDFSFAFKAMKDFETAYRKIRENEDAYASFRYFNRDGHPMIFESDCDPNVCGNGKGNSYGAYYSPRDKCIVVPCFRYRGLDKTLLHELFHHVDMDSSFHFSDTDLVKYSFMLTERSDRTPTYSKTNRIALQMSRVGSSYHVKDFESELIANVMAQQENCYEDSPLISRIYTIGQKLSKLNLELKPEEMLAIENRIRNALKNVPEQKELDNEYYAWRDKKGYHLSIKEYKKLRNEELENFGSDAKRFQDALLPVMDRLISDIQILEQNKQAGCIIIPPELFDQKIDGQLPEVAFGGLEKNVLGLKKCINAFKETQTDSDLLKCLYLVPEVWKDKFPSSVFSVDLDIQNHLKYISNKEKTLDTLISFASSMDSGLDEFDVKASLINAKSFENLDSGEKLNSYLSDLSKIKGTSGGETGKIDILLSKISKECSTVLEENGYDAQILKGVFDQCGKDKSKLWIYSHNLRLVLHYLKQGYSETAVKAMLDHLVEQSDKRESASYQFVLDKIPEAERYKPVSTKTDSKFENQGTEDVTRSSLRHNLALKLQEMRSDYGPKAKLISQSNRTVAELRKKINQTK